MASHRSTSFAAAMILGLTTAGALAQEQETWQPFNPFSDVDKRKAEKLKRQQEAAPAEQDTRPYLQPMNGQIPSSDSAAAGGSTAYPPAAGAVDVAAPPGTAPRPATVMREAIPPPVEKGDLTPVMSTDGSNLPFELWRGLDLAGVERLISELAIPPRSPALHNLWKRLITSDVTPPSGESASMKFQALRLEALYRSGLAKEAAAEIARAPAGQDAVVAALAARNELASGHTQAGCTLAQQSSNPKAEMPKSLKAEAILISGYCAAAANDAAGAGLAGELAREEGIESSPGLDALDAISINAKPKLQAIKKITLLDYLLLDKAGASLDAEVAAKGEPALLAAVANDGAKPVPLRLAATEAALRLNALAPETVAAIYRAAPAPEKVDARLASEAGGPERRAALFKAAEAEQTPMKKTRIIRAFLDEAKKSSFLFQALQMIAPTAEKISPQPETSWFAETGVEVALASGKYDLARRWIKLSDASQGIAAAPERGGSLDHWLALADIADPDFPARGESLQALESVTGRFSPDMLHRLATVLDALTYNVPIPLWDAMSRTPQPSTGYLPPTGVLSELQEASKKREFGHTVLLAMKALGPDGAEGAHMIALGDSIRALKRAGLEADARRLGLEALLGGWPRSVTN